MKVAVLVPVYNAEHYLRECLDSILAQQGVDLEIFCCNDGSKDGSENILKEYAARYPSVHYISQANAGVVAARNRLLDDLSEDIDAFAFVDSDDYINQGMYFALAKAMEESDADVAECGAGTVRVIDDMSIFLLRRTSIGGWINIINKLYRRSSVGKFRFRTGLAFEEDFFYNYEINAAIKRKVLVAESFYNYRPNPNSATSALNLKKYFASASERIRLSSEVFLNAGRIPKDKETAFRSELAKDAYRMMIRKNLKKNKNAKERKELFLAASDYFGKLERDYDFKAIGLNPIQHLLYWCCRARQYFLAQLLVLFT